MDSHNLLVLLPFLISCIIVYKQYNYITDSTIASLGSASFLYAIFATIYIAERNNTITRLVSSFCSTLTNSTKLYGTYTKFLEFQYNRSCMLATINYRSEIQQGIITSVNKDLSEKFGSEYKFYKWITKEDEQNKDIIPENSDVWPMFRFINDEGVQIYHTCKKVQSEVQSPHMLVSRFKIGNTQESTEVTITVK